MISKSNNRDQHVPSRSILDTGCNQQTQTASPSTIQLSNSQGTESTVTLSSPSQDSDFDMPQTRASVECQTTEVITISKEEYEELLHKAAGIIDIGDLEKLKTFFLACDPQPAVMDPSRFQDISTQVGAANLFSTLYTAMSSPRMSDERQQLNKASSHGCTLYHDVLKVTAGQLFSCIPGKIPAAIWHQPTRFSIS